MCLRLLAKPRHTGFCLNESANTTASPLSNAMKSTNDDFPKRKTWILYYHSCLGEVRGSVSLQFSSYRPSLFLFSYALLLSSSLTINICSFVSGTEVWNKQKAYNQHHLGMIRWPYRVNASWSGLHGEVPEKHLFLLYWLCQSLWLCGSQQTMENS